MSIVRLRERAASVRSSEDSGSILVLSLGFLLLCLALTAVVVDVSVVYLARRDLLAATDGAALAGAQALDADHAYRFGVGPTLPLGSGTTPRGVVAAVDTYTRRAYPAVEHDGAQFAASTTGTTVTVRATKGVQLPFGAYLRELGIGPVVIHASSTASAHRSS